MKILTNSSNRCIGGIEKGINLIVNEGKERNHQFSFVLKDFYSQNDSSNFDKSFPEFLIGLNIIEDWKQSFIDNNGPDLNLIERFKNKLIPFFSKIKPDIVLINGTYNIPYILSLICRDLSIPYVLAVKGILEKEVQVPNLTLNIGFELSQYASKVIFNSKLCRDTFIGLGNKLISSEVVYNGFSKSHLNLDDSFKRSGIGWVGRNSYVKNSALLYEIIRKSSDDFYLISDSINEDSLSNLFTVPLISDPIDLTHFYSSRNLMISTSLFETWSNVAIESLMAGTPFLINSNMGVVEAYQNLGLENLIVEDLTVDSYLNLIYDNLGMRVPIEIRLKLAEMYSPKNMGNGYINILESVYNKRCN